MSYENHHPIDEWDEQEKRSPWWAALIVITLIIIANFCIPMSCRGAECDTIPLMSGRIEKIFQTQAPKQKFYVVYNDGHYKDIIQINKTTYEYIILCRKNGVEPILGMRRKNEVIQSIVKYKRKIRRTLSVNVK